MRQAGVWILALAFALASQPALSLDAGVDGDQDGVHDDIEFYLGSDKVRAIIGGSSRPALPPPWWRGPGWR